jgi:hypothetical protein
MSATIAGGRRGHPGPILQMHGLAEGVLYYEAILFGRGGTEGLPPLCRDRFAQPYFLPHCLGVDERLRAVAISGGLCAALRGSAFPGALGQTGSSGPWEYEEYLRRAVAAGLSTDAVVFSPRTRVTIVDGRWNINGSVTNPGSKAEGLLMNVRMVNSIFEDSGKSEFDPETDDTLRRSLDQFYEAYPGTKPTKPVELSDSPLANMHAELSRLNPKRFFAFMYEKLMAKQWANARENFRQICPD